MQSTLEAFSSLKSELNNAGQPLKLSGDTLLSAAGINLEYGFNAISDDFLNKLIVLLQDSGFAQKRKALLAGEVVNVTEDRPAWHTALRDPSPPVEVRECFAKMTELAEKIRSGNWPAKITDVVNIGIGGSDLGPDFVYHALKPFADGPQCHYVSNLDEYQIKNVLENLKQEKTLFVVVSKTFTTLETLTNANYARDWIKQKITNIAPHFIAVSVNVEKAIEFGMDAQHVLPMWDWVGGRYSVWSAVGFSLVLALGEQGFKEFLSGAHAMDQHFAQAENKYNIPVILGLLGVWYNNVLGAQTQAVIPYADQLKLLPNYLQQLFMESLGKRVNENGCELGCDTGAVIWGGVGTNSQHAFHQLLMQGTQLIPIDFVLPLNNQAVSKENSLSMMANCLAQIKALSEGRKDEANYKVILPNHPLNLIMLDELNPSCLGALLAMYEHMVFVQSVVWGIDAFDQWGVELGKIIARELYPALQTQVGSRSCAPADVEKILVG